jgi:hypothetical protein
LPWKNGRQFAPADRLVDVQQTAPFAFCLQALALEDHFFAAAVRLP